MITFSLIFELPYQVIDLHVWSFLILVRYWRVDVLRRAIKYIRWLERLIKVLRRDHLEADYAISMYHGAFYLQEDAQTKLWIVNTCQNLMLKFQNTHIGKVLFTSL